MMTNSVDAAQMKSFNRIRLGLKFSFALAPHKGDGSVLIESDWD